MDALNSSSFTAFVGIDWADSKHDVCIQGAGCEHREFDIIPHKVERIDEWVQSPRVSKKGRYGEISASTKWTS